MTQPDSPPLTFLRLFAGEDGESHFEAQPIGDQESADLVQGEYLSAGAAFACSLRVVPAGWTRDRGPTKQTTLAVYISGEGVVEASDGDRRAVRPGVVLIAEDTTGRGHAARVTGHQPLAVMHITLSDPPRP
ncbi:MAG: hypothetical protein JJE47_09500 [Acidimicrobiia bacterium]|nr:hypothetical protein [Acidimicrobiia bacterium]